MKNRLAFLLPVFAMTLVPEAGGQPAPTPPQPKVNAVMVLTAPKPGVTFAQIVKVMPEEIRATVALYLDGKVQQWFMRGDGKGVIFILNCKDVDEARQLMEGLPLEKANLVDPQYIPIGPLLPLGILLRENAPAK